MIGAGKLHDGLFLFQLPVTHPKCLQSTSSSNLWHQRLGHPSHQRLQLLSNYISDLNVSNLNQVCEVCPLAKQTRLPFALSNKNSLEPFDLIHCDIWGKYHVASLSGAHYFLTIVDDHTRCTWIFLMKCKSETCLLIQSFYSYVETQFNKKIKVLRSDNGLEFNMIDFYRIKGIIHEKSCVNTPQQNGIVERKHGHLLNVARALRFQAALPLQFWGECVLTAAYLINRTPNPLLNGKTPYEMLFEAIPSYSHLKVFGCLCYATNTNTSKTKFDARATRCIFLGYPYAQKGYKLYDLNN